ncbi:hypothetical protein QBC37DRAFT_386337 [Rhypophila decipiens]|uniref:NACHT domain-containing protein n=1 Tax=Rhypophila decipiens TaxID=261697 RepID=A0AAN6YB83_9PEZI|nr:hypothetical protein QBC37DRAFT_386337 [Rhypophila decipiens]
MDPVSALSVAAAVGQFTDFTRQIVCKGKELYRSTEGLTREFLGTQTITLRLKELATNIKASQAALPTSGGRENLDRLCIDCMTISDQLLARLQRLKVPEDANHRRWKSFRQALKSVWSKDEIDAMAKRLSTLREELTTEILVATSLLTIASKADEPSGDVAIRTAVEALTEAQTSEFRNLCHQFVVSSNELRAISNRSKKAICDVLERQETALNQQLGHHYHSLQQLFDAFSAERAAVVESDTEKRLAQVQVSILNSLRFHDMEYRFESIAKPHEKTLLWIFKNPRQHQRPWSNFVEWLEHDIVSQPNTSITGPQRPAKARLIQGAFFFWNSGSMKQRSHEGLYRTLLYEILVHAPDLLPKVFPERWHRYSELTRCDLAIQPETWSSPDQLRQALERLISLASPSLRLCFFIDGLDEAEGDAQEIAEFIHDLSEKSSNVKFCVSSRPWPVFETIFDESPSLRLQDLTRDDIKTFVTDRLWANKSIQRLLKHGPDTLPALANEITKRASGVFLWVSIVVKSLTRGIRDGDSLAMLWRRVEELPADMESLYLHILKSIQQEYPEESSQIFQIFRANGNTLDVLTLSLALRSPIYHLEAMSCDLIPLSRLQDSRFTIFLDGVMGSTTGFLNSRCQGLLEVSDCYDEDFDEDGGTIDGLLDPEWPNFDPLDLQPSVLRQTPLTPPRKLRNPTPVGSYSQFEKPIKYLHRTTRDFIEQPSIWSMISEKTAKTEFHPSTALLISAVLGVKTSPVVFGGDVQGHSLVSDMGQYLKTLDIPPSDRNFDLIEELDRALSARLMETAVGVVQATPYPRSTLKPKRKAVWTGEALSTMMQAQHPWYRKIKRSNEAFSCYVSDEGGLPIVFRSFGTETCGSLLAFALQINRWKSWLDNPPSSSGELWPQPLSLIEFVLCSEESPRYVQVSQRSLWSHVINFIHILHGYEEIERETFVNWLTICKLMVHYGADPYVCCLEDLDTMAFYDAISEFRFLDPNPLDSRIPSPSPRKPDNSFLQAGQNHELSGGCDGRTRPGQSRPTSHSFEEVVKEVFVKRRIPGAREFLRVVSAKKGYWGGPSGLGLNFDENEKDDGPEIPRWVS